MRVVTDEIPRLLVEQEDAPTCAVDRFPKIAVPDLQDTAACACFSDYGVALNASVKN